MMKRLLFVLAIALLVAGTASAQAFFEDWESGINSPWVQQGSVGMVWSNAQNHTPGGQYSALYTGSVANSQAAVNRVITGGYENWFLDFWFFDAGPNTGMRSYIQAGSYTGAWGTGLQQLICLGAYNSGVDTSKYNIRLAIGGINWTNTNVTRTNGWHHFRVEAGNGKYKFITDGDEQMFDSPTYALSEIRVGSYLSTNGVNSYFDDITYGELVPEPGSMLALGTGLVGLVGLLRRRIA